MESQGGNFELHRQGDNRSLKQEILELVMGAGEYITETFNLQEYTDNAKNFIRTNPFISSFLAISLATCLIPVLTFLIFAFSTLFVSLVILLLIAGSIISFAGLVLLFVLGGCLTFSFGTSVAMALTFRVVSALLNMFQRGQSSKLSSQPTPGILVSNLSSKSDSGRQESDESKEK
ncbi:uncharacterized protein [Apostichopus japonicus]|uniref:uncharacterized protein n=1 Tax=Stichopus japonicus TaxID=307972 RepID=UPI003AB54480